MGARCSCFNGVSKKIGCSAAVAQSCTDTIRPVEVPKESVDTDRSETATCSPVTLVAASSDCPLGSAMLERATEGNSDECTPAIEELGDVGTLDLSLADAPNVIDDLCNCDVIVDECTPAPKAADVVTVTANYRLAAPLPTSTVDSTISNIFAEVLVSPGDALQSPENYDVPDEIPRSVAQVKNPATMTVAKEQQAMPVTPPLSPLLDCRGQQATSLSEPPPAAPPMWTALVCTELEEVHEARVPKPYESSTPMGSFAREESRGEPFAHERESNMLPVAVPVLDPHIDTTETSASCFCGLEQCFVVPMDEQIIQPRMSPKPIMVSSGDRLDVVWRVVAKTFIRKDMAIDSARIYPLAVDDEITVTAIVDAELRTIAPAVGWISLVSTVGEPLVMMGGFEATPPQSYPAADLSEAFFATIERDDAQHAAVLAQDLIGSGCLDALHLATVRRVVAEGRSSWGGVCQKLDAVFGDWDPPAAEHGLDFFALKAAILSGDSGRANELLRRPRAAFHLAGALPQPYVASVEELLAVSARRGAKAKRQLSCVCGMSTCGKCASTVWERLLQSISDEDKASTDEKIRALSVLENSTFVVHVETDANSTGTYEYAGEKSFRPVYRLSKSQQLPKTPRRLLRWQPGRGYDGEWRLLGGEGLTPLYCATGKGCSAAESWLPPAGQWQPIGHHSGGRHAEVRLKVRAVEPPAAAKPPSSLHPVARDTGRAGRASEIVALAGPPSAPQRVRAPILAPGAALTLASCTSSQTPPTWQATFVDDAKAASKCVAGLQQLPAAPKPWQQADVAADSRAG